jgi:GAF domain-containing protein
MVNSSSGNVIVARRTDHVGALSAVARQAFGSAAEAAQAIFGLIHEITGMRICVLTKVDFAADTLTVLEASDQTDLGITAGMVVPLHDFPCETVARSAVPLRAVNVENHPSFRALPAYTKVGLRTYMGVPLTRSDGTIWGTLAATDTEVRPTTDADLHVITVLARLAAFEFEREEKRAALAKQAEMLEERLAMAESLDEERLRAVRLQTLLEAAVTVSHEVNNPLTVLLWRIERLKKRYAFDMETMNDLEVCLEAAEEINEVTVRLRKVVHPVSTHYLAGKTRMLDLSASVQTSDEPGKAEVAFATG